MVKLFSPNLALKIDDPSAEDISWKHYGASGQR